MITLYLATHNKTNLKYFGKTTQYHTEEDLQKYYHGSGTYWNKHLNKHGDDVTMQIFYQSEDEENVKALALMYSRFWNIENSSQYANLMIEDGLSGGAARNGQTNSKQHNDNIANGLRIAEYTKERNKNVSNSLLGRKLSDDHKKNISKATSGKNNPMFGKSCPTKGIKQNLVVCPYCNKSGGNAMFRWHFENCKLK